MSDKKEKQIFNNLTRVDFQKKSEDIISNYFLSKTEVHSILSVNFGNFSEKWFKCNGVRTVRIGKRLFEPYRSK